MTSRITKYLLLALFLFTPLILSSHTSEMFEIPKMIFLYVGISTATAFFLISVIRGEVTVRINIVHVLALLFVFSQFISLVFSIDMHTSWYGYYGRLNGGVLSTIHFALLFFISSQLVDSKSIKQVFLVSAISSVLVLGWGIPGRLLGADTACFYFRQEIGITCWTDEFRPAERMFATLGQPNWLGSYFATHVFFGIYLLVESHIKQAKKSIWQQALLLLMGAYIGLMVLGVYFTSSRSAQIALAIPLAIECLRRIFIRFGKNATISVATVVSIIILILGSLYIARIYSEDNQNITHSGKIRLIVWEGAVKLWEKYPVLGTGPETFAYSYFQTRPESHNKTSEKDFVYNKAHNEFLNILATTGSFGFVTYAALLAYCLYTLSRVPSSSSRVVAYAIICVTFCNTLGFSTSTSQLLLYFLLGIATALSRKDLLMFQLPKMSWRITTPLALSIFTVWIWVTLFLRSYIIADITYASAMSSYESGDPEGAMDLCRMAYMTKSEHVYADRCASINAGTALLLADSDDGSVGEYRDLYAKRADAFGQIATKSSPKNPLYLKSRARVLKILMNIYPKETKYKDELKSIVTRFRLLAPTDHTVL